MPDTTDISRARTTLYDALAGSTLAPWRVHRVSPDQIAAPCVYIDAFEMAPDDVNGVGFVAATFPVVAVADGAVRAQVEALDDIVAHIVTAALAAGFDFETSRPLSLDVGGPNLRAHVVRVSTLLQALTMCAPSLVTATTP